jgi:hypothetical protein
MDLNEIGYNVALAQMGLTKEANIWGRIGGFFSNAFKRGPAKPYIPTGATARASSSVDDAFAGIKAKPKELGMPDRKEMGGIEEGFVRRKNQGMLSPNAESNLPKNVARPDPVVRPPQPKAAPAPAPAAPPASAGAAPPPAPTGAPATGAAPPAAADAKKPGGMLGFVKNHPYMATLGAGGAGYGLGAFTAPPSGNQPMQQYGQPGMYQ